MVILDGKETSRAIKNEIALEVKELMKSGKKIPHLAAILVGNDGASETYVGSKVKTCHEIGFNSTLIRFDSTVTEQELLKKIIEINEDPEIDGLIVQSPLPSHISFHKVTETISPAKDVDGFHPINSGRMMQNIPAFIAATPKGIIMLLERYKIDTSGKNCVVIGRSNIVGMPMSILLARNSYPGNCTVTICHSKTKNLKEHCLNADIIIAALGKPGFLKSDFIKPGAVVIDVGITRIADPSRKSGFRLKGDVDFDEVAPKSGFISPVPGGVGPMTIIGLLQNTLIAAKKEIHF
ncbi:MAG TPA: tetrahydrofolate dehydrogenase/cyclohydrolase catalytic domain-containing protein [Bacteroidia bacterium]|nr:tetrahydrofolate dehydrogenase/cyclohydrolase catalytic domain-containing protein [Bacteroidia bacterium]